ncbi:tetratricopeptide repeat protein, partial [candidate division KSB1 bacterium]
AEYIFNVLNMWFLYTPLGVLILFIIVTKGIKRLDDNPFLVFLFYTAYVFFVISLIHPHFDYEYGSSWDCYTLLILPANLFIGLLLIKKYPSIIPKQCLIPGFIMLSLMYGGLILHSNIDDSISIKNAMIKEKNDKGYIGGSYSLLNTIVTHKQVADLRDLEIFINQYDSRLLMDNNPVDLLNREDAFNENYAPDLKTKSRFMEEYLTLLVKSHNMFKDTTAVSNLYKKSNDFFSWEHSQFPDDDKIVYRLFTSYRSNISKEKSIELKSLSIEINPSNPDYYVFLSLEYDFETDKEKVLELLLTADSLYQFVPNNKRAFKEDEFVKKLINAYTANGLFDNAFKLIQKASQEELVNAEITLAQELLLYGRARRLEQMDSLVQAIYGLKLEDKAKHELIDRAAGYTVQFFKDYNKFIKYNHYAMEFTSDSSYIACANFDISKAYFKYLNNAALAKKYALRAYNAKPDYKWERETDYMFLYDQLNTAGNKEESVKILIQADSLFVNTRVMRSLHNYYILNNKIKEALNILERLEIKEGNSASFVQNKALFYIKLRDWAKLDSVKSAPMGFTPSQVTEIYRNTADRILLMTNNIEQYISWNLKLAELAPEGAPLDTIYADVAKQYATLNDNENTLKYYRKALSINPAFKMP